MRSLENEIRSRRDSAEAAWLAGSGRAKEKGTKHLDR